MLKNVETYEIMRPEDVGVKETSLVLGKLSGRHAFRDKLQSWATTLPDDQAFEDAFRRFKDLADKKKHLFDEDIMALVDDEILARP
jgi:2-isopropylmalate synthase